MIPETCDSCGGKLAQSFTFECTQINLGDGEESKYLIIENIPTFECIQCGEKSFEPTVVERLELLRGKYKNDKNDKNDNHCGNRVTVISY